MSKTATNLSPELQLKGINVIRALALDGPEAANSGHQGTAMALAPLAHVLFTRVLRYDASDPQWPDRDRFVLSAGHASMLQYAMLYLTGYGLELDDLRDFRQWDSATPGHPEAGHTAGVEVTTGPLGQGFANAVGMAIAERFLRTTHGEELCNHHTYVIAGDGDLSEGVSHEAASLAGHLGLGRLIAFYDDNHITIDGPTELALTDNAAARFISYGWDVIELGEVPNDLNALTDAVSRAKRVTDRPTLIIIRSRIGYPSPGLTDHHSAHGNPFDATEIAATKKAMRLPPDESFWVPDDVLEMYRSAGGRGNSERLEWESRLASSDNKKAWEAGWNPSVESELLRNVADEYKPGSEVATRKASQACVTALADSVTGLIGGSADLTGNTGLKISDTAQSSGAGQGQQIYFGIREHAMGSALVGAARHGGVVPIAGTFLVFADYMRPPVRLAAMSKAKCVFVWTHDSVGVGEDGPTHQPVEQVMTLRAIPDLQVIRPADATEVAASWQLAMETEGPTALILSRQGIPVLEGSNFDLVAQGAYAVVDHDDPDLVLIGTGSEVSVCVEAAATLTENGHAVRVVSMPCWTRFEMQSEELQSAVLPPELPTVSLEAGVTLGWERYADIPLGINRFGASAPGKTVLNNLGINAENVVTAAEDLLS